MVTINYFPPKNWQDFETFIKDLSKEKYNSSFDLYGRSGQSQFGIDIIGTFDKKTIGLQCKHKMIANVGSKLFVAQISTKIIDDEIHEASNFSPSLDKFIIATTSFRDVKIQRHVAALNKKRELKMLFPIEIWFWETIEDEINSNFKIQKQYYEKVVSHFDSEYKEKHVLTSIRNAFFRPAFQTPFMLENNGNDFLKAIKDIQELLSTGKLKDRAGNYISGSLSYNNLKSATDRATFDKIYELLQQIRDYTTQKIKEHFIKQCRENCMCFSDQNVAVTLDQKRKEILNVLNSILKKYEIKTIQIRF